MLITRFNALIRNRILWAGIAFLVAFTFVGASVLSRSACEQAAEEQGIEGYLGGKPVTIPEFYAARLAELGLRPAPDLSPEAERLLRRNTWKRIAALRRAEAMGLSVTDEEVRRAIQNEPSFAVNGTFSPAQYRAFVQNTLRLDCATFENYLRQNLVLRKLLSVLRSAVWMAPSEAGPRLERLTDSVALAYALVPAGDATNRVLDVTEQEARSFLAENASLFRVPDQVSVRYVAFPISNYLAGIAATDEEIEQYYEDHLSDYMVQGTNEYPETQPMEDVRDAVIAELQRRKALFDANDEATRLVMALAPDRSGHAPGLEEAAHSRGLAVATSAFFSAFGDVPGIAAGPEFNRAAFSLEPNDPERYFSDAVSGEDAVYVLAVQERREAYDPDFEEVRSSAMEAAGRRAAREAFRDEVKELRTAVEALLAAGTNFDAAAESLGLAVSTTGLFTVYEGLPEEVPYGIDIIARILKTEEGRLGETLETPEGAMLLYVRERAPGDPSSVDIVRPQFVRAMDEYRSATLFEDWKEQVLAEAGLRDLRPLPVVSETESPAEQEG